MKIIEMKTILDSQGQIILPDEALPIAGLKPGDSIGAIIITPEEGERSMLLIIPQGVAVGTKLYQDEEGDEEEIQLPHALLEEADIPVDSDLEIICGNGDIHIRPSDPLTKLPDELRGLFDNLNINPDTLREVMKKEGYFL